jgi:hypothetical protein
VEYRVGTNENRPIVHQSKECSEGYNPHQLRYL